MKSVTSTLFLFSALVAMSEAFSGSSFTGSTVQMSARQSAAMRTNNLSMEYIPAGMSKEQWKKVKEQEKKKNGKNLGKVGITTFKSRSFADWQKAGGKNLFPVDPRSVKDPKDLPYMQRPGGSADDGDLKKGNAFGGLFNFGKKKAPEPEPEPEKKTNWWTL